MVLSLGTLCREIGSSPPELIGTVNGFGPLQLTSSSFAVLTCGVEPSGWYAMVNDTSYTVSITNTPMKSPITRTDNEKPTEYEHAKKEAEKWRELSHNIHPGRGFCLTQSTRWENLAVIAKDREASDKHSSDRYAMVNDTRYTVSITIQYL